MIIKRNIKKIYLVFYEVQDILGNDINMPIKAFKNKKTAQLYANSRNFEFQTVVPLNEQSHENYVLSNNYNDYTIAMSDLREAKNYLKAQLSADKYDTIWDGLFNILPFIVRGIEYCEDIEK